MKEFDGNDFLAEQEQLERQAKLAELRAPYERKMREAEEIDEARKKREALIESVLESLLEEERVRQAEDKRTEAKHARRKK
jgi:hypothetical protein